MARITNLLTVDGKHVPWPFAPDGVRTISLTEAELVALRDPNPLRRILAHEHLSTWHVVKLYAYRKRGLRLRRVARRIRELQLEPLCEGIGEARLTDTITLRATGPEIRAELCAMSTTPRAFFGMVTADAPFSTPNVSTDG